MDEVDAPIERPDVIVPDTGPLLLMSWQTLAEDPVKTRPALQTADEPAATGPTLPPPGRVSRLNEPEAARLFAVPRERSLPSTPPSRPAPPLEPEIRLVGIILIAEAGDERVALVEHGAPARVARLRAGDELPPSGWRVRTISRSSIDMIRGQDRRVLRLD